MSRGPWGDTSGSSQIFHCLAPSTRYPRQHPRSAGVCFFCHRLRLVLRTQASRGPPTRSTQHGLELATNRQRSITQRRVSSPYTRRLSPVSLAATPYETGRFNHPFACGQFSQYCKPGQSAGLIAAWRLVISEPRHQKNASGQLHPFALRRQVKVLLHSR